jgi:hypothetical protein
LDYGYADSSTFSMRSATHSASGTAMVLLSQDDPHRQDRQEHNTALEKEAWTNLEFQMIDHRNAGAGLSNHLPGPHCSHRAASLPDGRTTE